MRKQRCQLQKPLSAELNNVALFSRLGSGHILAPLRSAKEGETQLRRLQPGGHPMYLLDASLGDIAPADATSDLVMQSASGDPAIKQSSDSSLCGITLPAGLGDDSSSSVGVV